MRKLIQKRHFRHSILYLVLTLIFTIVYISCGQKKSNSGRAVSSHAPDTVEENWNTADINSITEPMPIYGNWRNFTTKDGLPTDKAYCVRIDGDRVLVGTHDGLAVYDKGKWTTITTKDGLPHNGIVSIDVSKKTGDVWIGTLAGLCRWSAGNFEIFNQVNSGLPNDLVYSVICEGDDVWTATGGGAGHYDTRTKQWEIFTEKNAPMHEPWTYGVSAGDGKIFIAAWGGGLIEYNSRTKHFKDYTDPDGEMEIDLLPDDGIVHDISTATSYSNGVLWVSTYFGLSRYNGTHWKAYFDHDSGLASNFINFIRASGSVVFICSDRGLSCTNGKNWVTYKKNDNNSDGKAIITNGTEKKELALSPSISHNFIIGVDADADKLWVATSNGVSCGELIK